jgi:hypothetical protein
LYENRLRQARCFALMLEHRLYHAPLSLWSYRPQWFRPSRAADFGLRLSVEKTEARKHLVIP